MPIAIIIIYFLCRLSPHEVGVDMTLIHFVLPISLLMVAFFRCFERIFVELCGNPIN
jgi:hypothetical protein